MLLSNLSRPNGMSKKKRVGRGSASGCGKTCSRGQNGSKSRSGFKIKRGFEGGQQPIQRRLPKIGFTSNVKKIYALNVDKHKEIIKLEKIDLKSIKSICRLKKNIRKVKLIGRSVGDIYSKIDDVDILCSKQKNMGNR